MPGIQHLLRDAIDVWKKGKDKRDPFLKISNPVLWRMGHSTHYSQSTGFLATLAHPNFSENSSADFMREGSVITYRNSLLLPAWVLVFISLFILGCTCVTQERADGWKSPFHTAIQVIRLLFSSVQCKTLTLFMFPFPNQGKQACPTGKGPLYSL